MNIKIQDLLLPFALALLTMWAVNYFWDNKQQTAEDVAGRRIEAPALAQRYEAPNLEIDFYDNEKKNEELVTVLENEHARYQFTNHGAALQHVTFIRCESGQMQHISVLDAPTEESRENRAYLVALNRQTPYYFDLIKQDQDETAHYLTYRADFGDGILEKKFTIYKDTFKISLNITVTPKADVEPVRLRIFFSAPRIKDLGAKDTLAAFVDESGKLLTYARPLAATGAYWEAPTVQGLNDRYFVDAFVNDANNFVQRGYFKPVSLSNEHMSLQGILESKPVSTQTSWNVSFYFGPKTADAMNAVDPRLEQTIDYGFFAAVSRPISKLLLKLLNGIYGYVHNYGWAIVILTLLMRLLMLPFTLQAQNAGKKNEEFQKRLKHIQMRYKDDPEALNQARMELIRKHGIMPGASGCLPLLAQLPLFWGLHVVLANSIELYNAPFLWINDLSSADPYYILPVLTGIGMMLATPTTSDPKQRIMSIGMGLFFMAIATNFSAGLALFMAVSMLAAALQLALTRGIK
ncbi:MAG: membrane protein insertase YidC [Candidatus Babeliales bacterium]